LNYFINSRATHASLIKQSNQEQIAMLTKISICHDCYLKIILT